MTTQSTLYPLEVSVEETPKSLAAMPASKRRWMSVLRNAAQARIHETVDWTILDDRPVSVTIFYFAVAGVEGDLDNIVKPILDALNGRAYSDDRYVERLLVQKFEPGSERTFSDVSASLAAVLEVEPPVVYIRVDDDLSWRAL